MEETDYKERIEVVEKWLRTAKEYIISKDYEFGFDKLTKCKMEIESILWSISDPYLSKLYQKAIKQKRRTKA